MSWYDFSTYSQKNKTKQLSIVLHYKDTSYQITPGVTVPECNQSSIDIVYDENDIVLSLEHYNDFGAEEDFTSVEDLADYITDNWEEESDDNISSLELVLQELDFSKLFRKVA